MRLRLLAALGLALVQTAVWGAEPAAAACTKSWAAPVSGFWNEGHRWSPPGVPDLNEDVCIDAAGSYTVVLQGSHQVNTLTLGAGSGAQALRVQAEGALFGNAALSSLNGMTIESSGALFLESTDGTFGASLTDAAITNNGRIIVLPGAGGARLINAPVTNNGSLDIQANTTVAPGNSLALTNNGTLVVRPAATLLMNQISSSLVQAAGQLNNFGTVELQPQVTFDYSGGVITANPVHITSGALSLGASSGPGRFMLHGTSLLLGDIKADQNVLVQADGVQGNATVILPASVTNNGTLTLAGDGIFTSAVTVAAGMTLTNAGTLTVAPAGDNGALFDGDVINNGTLDIANDVTFAASGDATLTNNSQITIYQGNTLNFPAAGRNLAQAGGNIHNLGALTIAGGTLDFTGGSFSGRPVSLVAAVTNFGASAGAGSFVATGLGVISGDIGAGHTIRVLGNGTQGDAALIALLGYINAGTILLDAEAAFNSSLVTASGTLVNDGTIMTGKGAGGGRHISGDFTNNGTLTLNAGLNFNQANSGGTFTNNGTMTLASSQVFEAETEIVVLSGGSLTIPPSGAMNLTNGSTLRLSGGALTGQPLLISSTLDIQATTPASVKFSGPTNTLLGDVASGQTLTVVANGTQGNASLDAISSFTNNGTIELTSTANFASLLTLTAGQGVFNSSTGQINFRKGQGGDRLLVGSLINEGTVAVETTTAFSTGAYVNAATGTISIGPSKTLGVLADLINAGTLNIAGTLDLTGAVFTQSSGSTDLASGILRAATINVDGGNLSGSGTLEGTVTNSGNFLPGGASDIDRLTVLGDYTQTASGTLTVELGGLLVAQEYDQLRVIGAATLDGTLSVGLADLFVPLPGNQFRVVRYNSLTGDFATKNGLLQGLIELVPALGSSDYVLGTIALP